MGVVNLVLEERKRVIMGDIGSWKSEDQDDRWQLRGKWDCVDVGCDESGVGEWREGNHGSINLR